MKFDLTVYAFDCWVNEDGTVDPHGIRFAQMALGEVTESMVVLGKASLEFNPPSPDVVRQSQIVGLEKAIEDYRRETVERLKEMQGRLNELKALEVKS